MTDEEKARKEICEKCSWKGINGQCFEHGSKLCGKVQTYLAGLAEGRKESLDALICEQEHVEMLEKENEELKAVCDYNCPDHKLATHNACLTCPAVRNSPYHDLKNVSDEELQQIIKDAETEMEM